ncbi:type II toxin-antitoxin system death-on-curing family toxin [Nostoc sp. C110]|uniref:type II toxin-antitoxin system death-on-curing family toxin n=1 Tax=Nostoc sp. C110 TaxID=3349876 RepID=UPI00370DA3F5
MKELIWIRDEVVVAIHRRQLAEHGGLEGIRDEGLVQSALYRPQNLLAYSESPPDIASLAAAYAYGIVKNHPFVDGNKRTAYVVMRTFLKLNGYDLQASSEEKYQIWIDLAAGKLSEEELAEWIRKHFSLS